MFAATILAVGLQAAAQGGANYPLAAAFVIGNRLVIADVPSRSLKPIPLPDLAPEEADLSLDKRQIVVSAQPKGSRRLRLYLVDVATGQVRPLAVPFAGDQRWPRFADGGKSVLFTATTKDRPDDASNRSQIEKLRLADGHVEPVPTNPDRCEFEPVATAGGKVAHLSTGCYLSFAVQSTDPRRHDSLTLGNVTDARSELASSPDGKKLVYTRRGRDGLGFFLVEGRKPVKHLASVVIARNHVQPRFMCPQNVLFLNGHEVSTLDTVSGKVGAVLDLREAMLEKPAAPAVVGAPSGTTAREERAAATGGAR